MVAHPIKNLRFFGWSNVDPGPGYGWEFNFCEAVSRKTPLYRDRSDRWVIVWSLAALIDQDVKKVMRRLLLIMGLGLSVPCMGVEVPGLLTAVGDGRVQAVRDLLATGADPNTLNPGGRPVLVVAASRGNTRTVRELLLAGADVNAADQAGNTALINASGYGFAQVVKLLLDSGADPNLKNAAGHTALARATQAGYQHIVTSLTAAGAVEAEEEAKEAKEE